jgi:pyruvate dehydrogenase E2 component (dihydrolipoamide acetyltransferase)
MPTYLEMPKLSDTMTEGTLAKWVKHVGDTVGVGDVVAEIETDKATMEMESFDEGVLHEVLVPEGGKVAVGARIAMLLEEGEEPPSGEAVESAPAPKSAPAPAPESGDTESTDSVPAPVVTASRDGSRVKASPLARKIAAAKGLDLTTLTGTGPGGRIVKADLEGAKAKGPAPAKAPSAAPARTLATPVPAAIPSIAASEGDQRIPLTGMRTIIAERLLASKTQIPHFYLNIEVDAAPLLALRVQINEGAGEHGNKYTVNDFILKAVVGAAAAVPQVNASFDGDAIIQYAAVNLSVAIAVEDGLVTPVIRDAQTKSLPQLSLAVKDLAQRSRSKKLTPDEFQGGTITVSNLGAYGIDTFDAIINPPQAAILSIGAAKAKPVVNEAGQIVVGQRMWIGMSCDHRVVDGAVGATYLAELRKRIERPALMLV